MSQFQEGWRVKMVPHTRFWETSSSNPGDCAGTITEVMDRDGDLIYKVDWDNGYQNSYGHTDLIPLQKDHKDYKPRGQTKKTFTESFI